MSGMLTRLVGRTVSEIRMSEDVLTLITDQGPMSWAVEGDCCSQSVFFDFYGVRHLLDNGPVLAFENVDLSPGDPGYHDCNGSDGCGGEFTQVYGYRITTEHPQFGPVTSVFSFRNYSNGYYGGWMFETDRHADSPPLVEDKVGES